MCVGVLCTMHVCGCAVYHVGAVYCVWVQCVLLYYMW